jgi:hypothetical protein
MQILNLKVKYFLGFQICPRTTAHLLLMILLETPNPWFMGVPDAEFRYGFALTYLHSGGLYRPWRNV